LQITTKHFGDIDIDEEKIINFPQGIIAFEKMKKFIIIDNPDKEVPFSWLQSIDNRDLAFVIINPFVFKQDYEIDIPENVLEELEIDDRETIAIFSIVVVPQDLNKMTANLLAPIIINTKNYMGKQIILNDKRYTTKHLIIDELKKNNTGEMKNAGTY